ncbi:interleukin-18-like [Syngnathus scovelli]|uniref:interleukin-18-like n=1 Tax=Syngnathus scovelli TaxID=161590 RepID=UPI0035CBE741
MMSTSGLSSKFLDVEKNCFRFQVPVDMDEQDGSTLRKSEQSFNRLIRNNDNKYLLLVDGSKFKVQNLTKQQQYNPGCKFTFHFYEKSSLEPMEGMPVMLYTITNSGKIVVCCGDHKKIYPKAMDIPDNIEDGNHEALFYMTQLSGTNKYMLESSRYPQECLGLQQLKEDPSHLTLVFKTYAEDEQCVITLL